MTFAGPNDAISKRKIENPSINGKVTTILVFIIFDQLRIIIQTCYYTQIEANCKLYKE